jgi:probable rRNA maturation factor
LAFPGHPGKAPTDAAAAGKLPSEPFALPPGTRQHLGDIIVSVERAIEQAEAGRGGQTGDVRWDARQELRLLATHGTLHVCGWDHVDPVEEAAMREVERRLLG